MNEKFIVDESKIHDDVLHLLGHLLHKDGVEYVCNLHGWLGLSGTGGPRKGHPMIRGGFSYPGETALVSAHYLFEGDGWVRIC